VNFAYPICLALLSSLLASSLSGQIVISQVFGGGGNAGASYQNDYVELFNRGSSAVKVDGWSIQYASATGNSWDRTVLSGSIVPGQYFLVQEQRGTVGSTPLPPSDVSGSINLSATSGKIALVSDQLPLVGSAPSGPRVIDFVGYGDANASLGQPALAPSSTSALIRLSGGCTDTRNNRADFSVLGPIPRNTNSPLNSCLASPEISALGITNAASFENRPVAPGEIVTIFGSNLGPELLAPLEFTSDGSHIANSVAGTRVLFDGTPAPIIYTQKGQVSAIVPFAVSGASTHIQVEYYGQTSNSITAPLSNSAPGVFTATGVGSGAASAINQDSTINAPLFPARKGSIVALYATGAGATTPPGEDGKIIQSNLPQLTLPVTVQIADQNAQVLYKGPAPGAVTGLIQVNFLVPEGIPAGKVALTLTIGGLSSQREVTLFVAPDGTEPIPGSGPAVETKLQQLRSVATVPPLPEIPNDESPIPATWLGLLSWNTQVGGTSTDPGAQRPPMVKSALSRAFAGTYSLLAAEEVPNTSSAQFLQTLLPGRSTNWTTNFFDSSDPMDNGTWFRNAAILRDSFALFTTGAQNVDGSSSADTTKAEHPPQVAQFAVGDFDFTLITVHLTFAGGDTSESAREMRNILDYLDWYFTQPDHDPDVLICGDFNTPSLLSGTSGKDGITLDQIINSDPRFQTGERRLAVTVHEPTSRNSATSGGLPVSNYDHCIVSANALNAFIQARRVATNVLTDDPQDPEARLTSDHFPIVAFFLTRGPGIFLDHKPTIRPQAMQVH